MSHNAVKNIRFHYLVNPFYFPGRSQLKIFLLSLFKSEGFGINHINYIFCNDDYLIEINRRHLRHDTYTDIITFPYSAKDEPVLSDIYISISRVRENATSLNVPFLEELHRVIIHGALHLCGYMDKSKSEMKTIRNKEDHYLKRLVSRGTK